MASLSYDKNLAIRIDCKKIKYGIIYGNNKIVFIKTGADGNVRGYQDKYLKMAYFIHNRLGATVICASNPYIEVGHVKADKDFISNVVKDSRFIEYELYLVGVSDGAYHNLRLAKEIPQTSKLLCVNTSTFDFDDLKERLSDLPMVNKILVYGERDDEYMYVPYLNELKFNRLQVVTIEGADHEFTGMGDTFISLADLI